MSSGLDLSQFYETFFDEADELLAQMEQLLLELDVGAPDIEQLNAIFRAAHSIKGGAATFGCFQKLAGTTHLLENLLDAIRRGEMGLRADMVDIFLETKDVLKSQLDAYRASEEPEDAVFERICAVLRQLALEGGQAPAAAAPAPVAAPEPGPEPAPAPQPAAASTAAGLPLRVRFSKVSDKDAQSLLEEMGNLGDVRAARPSIAPAHADKESTSIRVGVEKVDQVINLVGELVITQAMLAQTASTLDPVLHDRLLNGMEQLERNARDLQEAVMSIRMMPMDYVFSRFPRLVRDIAGKMGKQIELQTYGRATELDKSLIERIIDPLTHLVRNSLDHGIETPDKRVAAGKEPVGQLVLSAQHNGGNIVIEVSDDGGGLSRERILRKAAAQGLTVNENSPDDEIWQLIFAPGFSTADQVTDISGRGVGMDVVRRNIQDMGGHVQLSSVPGQGTTTRIVLPLTLAILDGMSVRVGEETFILPLNHVTESLQPQADQIYSVAGNERVMQVRGEYLPLVEMHRVFSVGQAQADPTQAIAVIMQAEERRFALLVDHLVGQHQVVVKNLESNYRKVPGISAATILGDGSVALIVDVFALARANREKWSQPEAILN